MMPQIFVTPPAEEFEFTVPVPLLFSGDLFKPNDFDGSATPKYGFSVVLTDAVLLTELTQSIQRVAKDAKVKLKHSPFKDGNEILEKFKDPSPEFQKLLVDATVFRASSQLPIETYIRAFSDGPVVVNTDEKNFLPGLLVLPFVALKAYKVGTTEGVTAYALSLYSTQRGDRLGGNAIAKGPRASWDKIDPPAKGPSKKTPNFHDDEIPF